MAIKIIVWIYTLHYCMIFLLQATCRPDLLIKKKREKHKLNVLLMCIFGVKSTYFVGDWMFYWIDHRTCLFCSHIISPNYGINWTHNWSYFYRWWFRPTMIVFNRLIVEVSHEFVSYFALVYARNAMFRTNLL